MVIQIIVLSSLQPNHTDNKEISSLMFYCTEKRGSSQFPESTNSLQLLGDRGDKKEFSIIMTKSQELF